MERLTLRSNQTSHDNGVCCTHFDGPECIERSGNCAKDCPWEEAAWSRLAAYEDTGLEPEEIMALRKQNSLLAQYGAQKFDASMEDFREINSLKLKVQSLEMSLNVACDALEKFTKAEREGRLVVLPCKVGDTVYFRTFAKNATVDLGIQPHEVTAIRTYVIVPGEFSQVGLPADHFGKTVFLTQEEAEGSVKNEN